MPPYKYFNDAQALQSPLAALGPNLKATADDRPPTFYFKLTLLRPIANHKSSITTLVSSHIRLLFKPIIDNSPWLSNGVHEVLATLSHPSFNIHYLRAGNNLSDLAYDMTDLFYFPRTTPKHSHPSVQFSTVELGTHNYNLHKTLLDMLCLRLGTPTAFSFELCARLRMIYLLHHPFAEKICYIGQTDATPTVLHTPKSNHRI